MKEIGRNIAKLIDLKTLLTLSMTATLIAILLGKFNPPQEFTTLFSTSYGMIITNYFNKNRNTQHSADEEEV